TRSDSGQKVVEPVVAKPLVNGVEGHAVDQAEPFQLALQHFAPALDVLVTILLAEPEANLGTCPRSMHVAKIGIEPVQARPAALGCQDFDLIARLELVV